MKGHIKGKTEERLCPSCGKPFNVFASRRADGKGNFCSRSCQSTFIRQPEQQARYFWSRVTNTSNPDDCWLWQGYIAANGYGKITSAAARHEAVHRFAYRIAYGNIPLGIYVLHHCDNPRCVNPHHLFLGTNQDNMTDMKAKSRQARGERAHKAKLTTEQVQEIRSAYIGDYGQLQLLAHMYGVCDSNIEFIVQKKSWRHV